MNQFLSILSLLAACRVEREEVSEPTPAATSGESGLTFGQAGGNDGGGLTPTTPDPTTADTGTAAEDPTEPDPTDTWEDTGAEPAECHQVTVIWAAPDEEAVSEISISGMLEAVYGGYEYVVDMQTGSPVGMTITVAPDWIAAEYATCVPMGARFEWSVSYRDAAGNVRYSCEGGTLVENGEFEVIVDLFEDAVFDEPAPVLNGSGGCEHEFWL